MSRLPADSDTFLRSCLVRIIVIDLYLLCFLVCIAVCIYIFDDMMSWYFSVLRSILYH